MSQSCCCVSILVWLSGLVFAKAHLQMEFSLTRSPYAHQASCLHNHRPSPWPHAPAATGPQPLAASHTGVSTGRKSVPRSPTDANVTYQWLPKLPRRETVSMTTPSPHDTPLTSQVPTSQRRAPLLFRPASLRSSSDCVPPLKKTSEKFVLKIPPSPRPRPVLNLS